MQLKTISPSMRNIKPTFHTERTTIYFKWHSIKKECMGVFELRDSATGNKYQIEATRSEWKEFHEKMLDAFSKAAASTPGEPL